MWSSDGALLGAVDERRVAWVWRTTDGAPAASTAPLALTMSLRAWPVPGLFAIDEDGVVARLTDGAQLRALPGAVACALTPSGEHVAWIAGEPAVAPVQGLRAGSAVATTIALLPAPVFGTALSPDGALFVVLARGAVDGTFQVAEVWALPATIVPPSGWSPPASQVRREAPRPG